jgi:hypothetical protein
VLEGSTYITPNYFAFTAPYNNQHVSILLSFESVLDIRPAVPAGVGSDFFMVEEPNPRCTGVQFYTSDLKVSAMSDTFRR